MTNALSSRQNALACPRDGGDEDDPSPDAEHPYMQVAERIRRRILDGVLKEGEKLPPVRELAKREGVSVATLGRSLDQLQVEGYITTSRKGTFVANAAVRRRDLRPPGSLPPACS
ncbi:GntR family transcriptional regulator [Streptomyces acidiscabies]|uniref:GntR family transcriptional regulator n=1 Tax=Streptomyces acidiscabies TaxID=42234 RepID=UPI0021163BFE|nr:GntR family transcriptional regulator [Streptomyces acidiscabies]